MDVGSLRHRVTLENPTRIPDGEGGYIEFWESLTPEAAQVSIRPATARDLERLTADATIVATASHVVHVRYHPQVSTKTRLTKGPRAANGTLGEGAREFAVSGVANPEERNRELVLICEERLP